MVSTVVRTIERAVSASAQLRIFAFVGFTVPKRRIVDALHGAGIGQAVFTGAASVSGAVFRSRR
jgi:hypothetical protein